MGIHYRHIAAEGIAAHAHGTAAHAKWLQLLCTQARLDDIKASQLSGAMTNLIYRCRYQRGGEVTHMRVLNSHLHVHYARHCALCRSTDQLSDPCQGAETLTFLAAN